MTSEHNPILSIIIVSAFDLVRLNRTLNSLPRSAQGLELLIVCPNQDESTRDVGLKFAEISSFPVRIIYDQNQGIYPAMNLGILNSSGRFLMFWNSGDYCYSPIAMDSFLTALKGPVSTWGVVQGFFDWRSPPELTQKNVERFVFQRSGYISHQCVFAEKSIVASLGCFDTKFLVAADKKIITELWLLAKPSLFDIQLVGVEPAGFSGFQHRRGRLENFKIAVDILPFPRALSAILSATKREIFYAIRKARKSLRLF